MGKTNNSTTQKQHKKRIRRDVYLPSEVMEKQFIKYAQGRGLSLSKLFQICVLERMTMVKDEESVEELKSKLSELEEMIQGLKGDVETKERAILSYKAELEEYQKKGEIDESPQRQKLDGDLIALLRNSTNPIKAEELPSLLSIEKDSDKMKSIMDNIYELAELGLIKFKPKGWVWKKIKSKQRK